MIINCYKLRHSQDSNSLKTKLFQLFIFCVQFSIYYGQYISSQTIGNEK